MSMNEADREGCRAILKQIEAQFAELAKMDQSAMSRATKAFFNEVQVNTACSIKSLGWVVYKG